MDPLLVASLIHLYKLILRTSLSWDALTTQLIFANYSDVSQAELPKIFFTHSQLWLSQQKVRARSRQTLDLHCNSRLHRMDREHQSSYKYSEHRLVWHWDITQLLFFRQLKQHQQFIWLVKHGHLFYLLDRRPSQVASSENFLRHHSDRLNCPDFNSHPVQVKALGPDYSTNSKFAFSLYSRKSLEPPRKMIL